MDSRRAQTWSPDDHKHGFPASAKMDSRWPQKWIPDDHKHGVPTCTKHGFLCHEMDSPVKNM
eukprot:2954405-Lingulodinium_polyedra.AAC.1